MRIAYFLLATLLFFSCQKVVTLKLTNAPPQLVIQGEVTDQPGPYTVTLGNSVNFYAENTFPAVSGAAVKISDNTGFTDTLTETSPGVYTTHTWQGVPGNTYTLVVIVNDTAWSAVSTMPLPVPLDSVTFTTASGRFGGKKNQQITAIANFQDPAGIKNYYRFMEYINGVALTKDIFVFDDRLSDGRYINFNLRNDTSYLNTGDQLRVDMYCVDANDYNYFFQLNRTTSTGAFNTTASPANPTTNLSNGAFGYFSAHTVSSGTVSVP
jgi:hypothetical protein